MFELPENLQELSLEELSALLDSALTEFNTLGANDDVSDEALERLSVLADGIEALRGQIGTAAAPVEAPAAPVVDPALAADRLAALRARVDVPAVEPVAPAVEPPAAPAEPVAVAASAAVPQKPRQAPSVEIPVETRPSVIIAAAADVRGFAASQLLTPQTLAQAIGNRAQGLTDSKGRQSVYPVASIDRPFGEGYDLTNMSEAAAWDAIAAGSDPNVLVASGGWCAPSEQLYDLFEVECENDTLFRLPTYKVSRGGIKWPVFTPHDETANPGFIHTEADDIAGAVKPCITIPCPTFTECRLDATGLCIKAGNLMDRAYPEQIRWFTNRAIRAYERNSALRQLNAVLADTVAVAVPASFGAGSALVSALLLQAADFRQVNGLCIGQQLDLLLPFWVLDEVKADIARQQGVLSGEGNLPSDASVKAWFAAAGLNVSFISHWQYFATHPATTWPASVQALLGYPGSYLRFDGGRLDLGVLRDSVLNSTNDFTAVWFEEFYCIGRRGPQSRLVTIPICPNGEVGGRVAAVGTGACPIG